MIAPDEFRAAVAAYPFPTEEAIYAVPAPLSEEALRPGQLPRRPWTYLFRGTRDSHASVAEFWAAALYNYLEEHYCDERFEALGAGGEYAPLDPLMAEAEISPLLGAHTGEYAALPSDVRECYRVYNTATLRAVAGCDEVGFFALILEPSAL